MLTDAPPRKANRAGFLESDRIKALDLPRNGHLQEIAQSLESAMEADNIRDVRSACAEFLASASPSMKFRHAACACLRPDHCVFAKTRSAELFGDYTRRDDADPRVDADGGAEGDHVLWDIPEHPMPRVLPSSRLSEVRVPRFVAYSRLLRASGCALPPCAWDTAKETVLGACGTWALAY